LGGIPVVARTLMALDQMPQVQEIIVVIRESDLKIMVDLVKKFDIRRVRKVVCAKRPGLELLTVGVYECEREAAFIGIHDPLRPFVTKEILAGALAAAEESGTGVPAVPVKDTIKIVRAGVVQETPDRSTLHLLQEPQIVESSLLKAAIQRAGEVAGMAQDLPTVLETLGLPLRLTEGADENIRVANSTDIPAAEAVLLRRAYA